MVEVEHVAEFEVELVVEVEDSRVVKGAVRVMVRAKVQLRV